MYYYRTQKAYSSFIPFQAFSLCKVKRVIPLVAMASVHLVACRHIFPFNIIIPSLPIVYNSCCQDAVRKSRVVIKIAVRVCQIYPETRAVPFLLSIHKCRLYTKFKSKNTMKSK